MGCDTHIHYTIKETESISTHAPVWGATFYHLKQYATLIISTHAPVWGATE
ncbi:hypothetical protein [Streptococcus sp. 2018162]|uniref:hypothetical protein n=1 Tax=Streptococcus sp. 2018162 TaxID=2870783 RepID=UPI001C8D4C17|nr:hypothetical protein [Streptococcus sp. 2018162]MBY0730793.1 hypothetical protein [Streptococcus sp. 2018162]